MLIYLEDKNLFAYLCAIFCKTINNYHYERN